MTIIVHIPTILRALTNDRPRIEAVGANVLEIIEHMDQQYPGLKERLMGEGKVHRFINIYVNDNDIRFIDQLVTSVKDGDALTILPAVAGGSGHQHSVYRSTVFPACG